MTAVDVLLVLAGALGHKVWRAGWMVRRGVPAAQAMRAEFAPPTERKPPRERPKSVTEVA